MIYYILILLWQSFAVNLEDIDNNKISIDSTTETYYIFLNDLICKECVAQLNTVLQNKKSANKIRIITVLKNSANLLTKRQKLKSTKLVIKSDEYCFRDATAQPDIFEKLIGKDYSPALVIQQATKIKLLTYNELFGDSSNYKNLEKKLNI